ncbi:alpha/beta fold hydrolase [Thalassomonas viridans]|uniref:Alpha/beta fold hydrolase n=1 Tax=Thalassomonas viridans TaxID=137584 RepID=A0AAE9YZX6_9GAMM|nr:alpha/beta fold hydrolase [Thalassomonas viridans]WDE03489.1 alpha/beta fold hydrolase [Thalassomonas viridans]
MKLVNYQQNGTGPDVLLIHGLFGSMENLNMVAKGLATHYRVTSMDVRNHGGSFHEKEMAYEVMAQDVITLLDHLDIRETAILGHSMGGKIAMEVALSFPERVSKLLVADISPVAYPPHHQQIIQGLQSIDLNSISKRKEADEQLARYVDNLGVRQFLLRNLAILDGKLHFKCNLDYIAECYPQIMQGYQGEGQYQGNTLFIKGGDSDYIRAEHRELIQKLYPNSQAKIIQGAGHWLHAEKTSIFNKIVGDFLQS